MPVATWDGFAAESPPMVLPHKIATLLYCFDADDRLLLLERPAGAVEGRGGRLASPRRTTS